MAIYIEFVILNNFSANLMILYIALMLIRGRVQWWRLTLSSLVGTIYAVILPYISFKGDFFIKILLSLVMVFIAFSGHSFRDYCRYTLAFYAVTFIFGGTLIAMTYFIHTDFVNILRYPNSLVGTYVSLFVLIMAIFLRLIITRYRNVHVLNRCVYEVYMKNKQRSVHSSGYLDTGNRLYLGAHPVVVVDECILNNIVDIANEQGHKLHLSTVNGESTALAYKVDMVELIAGSEHKYYTSAYVTCANRELGDYKIILHSSM